MYKKFTKHKKILDKNGFISFIIMVTWLAALGGKIKGKGLHSLPLSFGGN